MNGPMTLDDLQALRETLDRSATAEPLPYVVVPINLKLGRPYRRRWFCRRRAFVRRRRWCWSVRA